MSIRPTNQHGLSSSKSFAKFSRFQVKANKLREKVKSLTFAMEQRRVSRVAWWQRTFKTPLVSFCNLIFSNVRSIWAGMMMLIGLRPKSVRLTGGRRNRNPQTQVRALFAEGLEARQLMAADIEFALSSTASTEGASTGGPELVVFGDNLTAASAVDRTVSFTIVNSSTEPGDVGSNGVSGITATFEIPAADYSVTAGVFDLQKLYAPNLVPSISITDDRLVEGPESFVVLISGFGGMLKIGDANKAGGTQSSTAHVINDNDTATVAFSSATSATLETTSSHNVEVKLQLTTSGTGPAALESTVTVDVSQSGGTASGADFSFPASPMAVFVGGSTNNATANVALKITNDLLVEGTENAVLSLGVPTGAATSSVATHGVTITDDDTATVAIVAAKSVTEAGGAQNVAVTLTLGGTGTGAASLEIPVSVDVIDAGGGTAVSVTDYVAVGTQTLSFGAGAKSGDTKNASIDPVSDGDLEGNETLNLKLDNLTVATGVSLGNAASIVTIADDETATATIDATGTLTEDVSADTTPNVILTITGTKSVGSFQLGAGVSVDVDLKAVAASAVAADYTLSPTKVTFTGSTTSIPAPIVSVNDGLLEGNEGFALGVDAITAIGAGASALTAIGGAKSSAITIVDDESATVGFQAGVANGTEGTIFNSKDIELIITGSKSSGDFELQSGVSIAVFNTDNSVTATAAADFFTFFNPPSFFVGGTATGKSGAVGNLTIDTSGPRNDSFLEGTETGKITLSSFSTNGTGLTQPVVSFATTTSDFEIIDDETAVVSIAGGTVTEDGGAKPGPVVTLTITPGAGSSGPLELSNSAENKVTLSGDIVDTAGTAANPGDYALTAGTKFSFAPGTASASSSAATVTPVNDVLYEGTESFTGKIDKFAVAATVPFATVAATASAASATVNITDNEQAKFKFSSASSDVHETSGPGIAKVELEITGNGVPGVGSLQTGVTVGANVVATGGSATSPADFGAFAPPTVSFTGVATGAFVDVSIPIVNDGPGEGTETANLGFTGLTGGATVGTFATHALNIHDRVVTIKATDTNPIEDAISNSTFEVIVNTASPNPVVVTFTIDGANTATFGGLLADYKFGPQVTGSGPFTVTIPAGATSTTFDVDILDDLLFDPNETIKLNLAGASSAPALIVLGSASSATMIIKDNEAAPVLSISGVTNGAEGQPTAGSDGKFNVSISSGLDDVATAVFALGGDATNTVDYNFVPSVGTATVAGGKLTISNIPAGTLAFEIVVDVLNENNNVENTETVTLTPESLTDGSGSLVTSTVSITDDDEARVSIGNTLGTDVTKAENASDQTITFLMNNRISPFGAMTASTPTTVNFTRTQDADTAYGSDYVLYSNIDTAVAPSVATNDTFASAQSLNSGRWNIGSAASINNSTSIPHITVSGTADGTLEYYSFTLLEPSVVTIDIDIAGVASAGNDSFVAIWNSTGVLQGSNNDGTVGPSEGGFLGSDSALTTATLPAGTYVIGLARASGVTTPASGFGVGSTGLAAGTAFALHVSATSAQSAEPTQALIAAGQSSAIMLFNVINEAAPLLESDEFVEYTLTGFAAGFDPQITVDSEKLNTPDDNVFRITIDEVTTGNVKIEGTSGNPIGDVAPDRLNGAEPSSNGRFLITMSSPADRPVVVPFRINNASLAKIGATNDFTFGATVAGTGTGTDPYRVTIATGATTAVIAINVVNDDIVEIDEILTLDLLDNPNNPPTILNQFLAGPDNDAQLVPGTPNSESILIKDEDLAVINVNSSTDKAFEGGADGVFTIFLSKGKDDGKGNIEALLPTLSNTTTSSTETVVTYQITFANGAKAGDINPVLPLTGSITIPANSTATTIVIDALTDKLNEGTEDVILEILSVSKGDSNIAINTTAAKDTVFIVDNNKTTVSIKATDNVGAETGSNNIVFTVTLDGDAIDPATAVTVNYTVAGTATETLDYKLLSKSVVIPSGQTQATILVEVQDDLTVEPVETVILTLTSVTGAPLGVDVALDSNPANITDTATIVNPEDTGLVSIKALNASDLVMQEGKDNALLYVELNNPSATGVLVNYTVTSTSLPTQSTPGSDYTTLSGSVFVLPNQTSALIPITVLDDAILETTSENIILTLTTFGNPNYGPGAPTSQTVTILPDPTVKVLPGANATEGVSTGNFVIELSSASTTNTLVTYSLGGGAVEGTDYASQVKTAVILAGQTQVSVVIDPVTVGNDFVLEGPESVVITLLAVANVSPDAGADIKVSSVVGENTATINIVDDDKAYVTVAAVDGKEGGANGKFNFTLRDVNGNPTTSTTPITVSYNLLGSSTATNGGVDYASLTGSIVIPANATSTTADVVISADLIIEGTETVSIDMTGTDDARVQIGTIAGKSISFQNGAGGYTGTEDIYIDQLSPTINNDTLGLFANADSLGLGATTAQQSLLKFGGIFGPGGILAGSKISAANLQLWVPSDIGLVPNPPANGAISLHEALINWNESLTWDNSDSFGDFVDGIAPNGKDAKNAGLAFTLSSNPTGAPLVNNIPVTGTVQSWSNTPASNFGWAILADDTVNGTFALDSEFITINFRPRLQVTVDTSATVNIVDDDTSAIDIKAVTAAVEDITNGVVTVEIAKTIPAANSLVIDYQVGGAGSAVAGSDYTAVTGKITIPGGSTSSFFQVPVLLDNLIEGKEDVQVKLLSFAVTGPNATAVQSGLSLGKSTEMVDIIDNDTSTVDVSVLTSGTEVDGPGTHTDPVFRISLNPSTSTTDTVVTFTITGSANFIAGQDYVAPSVTSLTIPAGSSFTDFTLDLIDDLVDEAKEEVTLTLTGITKFNPGITLGVASAKDEIEDDDVLTADITATDNLAKENPTSNTGVFTFSLGASDKVTTVPFTISGTAAPLTSPAIFPSVSVSGPDFGLTGTSVSFSSLTAGTITFPASLTPQTTTITVTAVQDYIAEPGVPETVILTLGTPSNTNGAVGGNGDSDVVNIEDEDFTVKVEKTDSPAQEDGPPLSGSNGQFTISIANPIPASNVLVPFTIVNGKIAGTATYDGGLPPGEIGDYSVTGAGVSVTSITPTVVSGTATILAGSTSALITVDVTADSLTEGTENVVLSIGTPTDTKGLSKLTLVPAQVTATEQIADNDVSKVSISVIDDTDGAGSADVPGIGETLLPTSQNDGAFRFSLDKKVEYVNTVVRFTVQSPATTATLAADYNLTGPITGGPVTYTVTIPANTSFVDVGLDVLADLEIEGPEDVVLKITNVTPIPGMSVSVDGTKDTGTATITDNDVLSVSVVAIDADAKEPSNPGIFWVSLPPGVTSKTNTVVTYSTAGTANTGTIANNDYTPLSGTVTILAGNTTASISVVTLDDDVVEADETVIVTLTSPGASGSATVVIDSEDTSAVSILSKTDGEEDSKAATLTVSMTKVADQPITIPLTNLGGTATGGGTDYTLPASVTIPAGQTSATVNIAVSSDTLVEGTENFTVELLAPTGVYVPPDVTASGSQLIQITDNDQSVLSFNAPKIKELDSGTSLMTFVVTNPSKVGDAFTVQYKVKGGTASLGASPNDYTGGTGTLSFVGNAGETQTFSITVNGDEIVEADETIVVEFGTVTSPTPAVVAQINATGTGTGTIENDDTATITVTSDSKTEGSTLTFNISSDKQIDIPVTLKVNYSGGDAKGVSWASPYSPLFGDDYDNREDTVTLSALSKGPVSVTVNTNLDTIVEGLQSLPLGTFGSESFNVLTVGSTASPRSINPIANAVGTINDDDSTIVTVTSKKSAGDDDASEPGAGKGDGLFTFELSPSTSVQSPVVISYTYKIAGAAGDPNGDLKAPLSGTITIPASITSANVSTTLKIEAFDDSVLEDDEIVELTITGVTIDPNVSFTNTPANQTVNLQDDDSALITISATDAIATEPGIKAGDTATYTVSLNKLSDTPTTISLAIDAGTTASGSDYSGLPAFVTIPALTLSTTFTITATDDVVKEADEFLVVRLVPGTIFGNADITIGSPSSDKITIKDDGDDLTVSVKKSRDGQEPGINALDEGQFIVEITDSLGNPAIVPIGSTTGGAGLKIIYSVAGVTASQPNDFNAPTGILTILEGASSGLISIDVTDDALVEPTETLKITLSKIEDTSGVITSLPGTGEKISFGTSTANMDIKDDDKAIFTVDDMIVNEVDKTGTITIKISNELVGVSVPVTVNYTPLTASSPGDFAPSGSQTVTFLPGSLASQTVTFTIVDDLIFDEGLEGFGISLTTSYVNAPGSPVVDTTDTAVIGILDNDISLLKVTDVKVGSSFWSPTFNDFVDNTGAPVGQRGYSVPTGAAQATPLPWNGVNRIIVGFSNDPDPASLVVGNFKLFGLQGASTPTITAVSYDTATNLAVLTLSGEVINDRLRLQISDSLTYLGNGLDGEWLNGVSSYSTGNGTPGGTFNFTFNVLPGDVNQSSSVTIADASTAFQAVGASTDGTVAIASPNLIPYSIFADINGSGTITGADATAAFGRAGFPNNFLPAGSPGSFMAPGTGGQSNGSGSTESMLERLRQQLGNWVPNPIANPVDQSFSELDSNEGMLMGYDLGSLVDSKESDDSGDASLDNLWSELGDLLGEE